jgi:hypothetical protein
LGGSSPSGFRSALYVPTSLCKEKFDKGLFLWYIRVSPEFEGVNPGLKKKQNLRWHEYAGGGFLF